MITPTIPIFTGSYIDYYDIHEIRHMYDTFHQQRYSDRRVSKVTVTLTKARLNLRLTGCLTGCFAFSLSSDRARGGLTPAILQLTSPPHTAEMASLLALSTATPTVRRSKRGRL